MATEVKRRRGTTVEHSTFTGAIAELTVDLTKDTVVVHDGATQGGFPLLREDLSNVPTTAPFTHITLDTAIFDTTYSETGSETQGTLYWNQDEETLSLVTNGETIELGQKVEVHVKNQTGSQINKGEVVYASGTVGASGRILVTKMIADGTIAAKRILGVAAENIANGADGKVIKFGKLRKIDTTAFNEGDILWVSTTVAGAFQNTEPSQSAGDISLPIAFVVTDSASVGEIFIRVTPIDENEYQDYDAGLADIAGLTPTDSNFIVGNGTNWVAESGDTARLSLGVGSTDSPTFAGLTVNGSITVTGNVDGRDVSGDGANLDELYTTIGLSALTTDEVNQLENIGDETISATQWGYLGELDQPLKQADSPTFSRVVLTNQADDGTKAVRADRNVSAGNGVTGGGDLTADRTITLGTPNTTTVDGSNAVTADSHTHALDLSGRSITLSDDSDSVITFDTGIGDNTQDLGADRTFTPTIADHGNGQRGVLNTTTQSIYGSKTVINDFKVTTQIESASGFTSGILGAGTRYDMDDGNGSFFEVDNMRVRNEMRVHIFKKDIVKASNAYLFITDSAEIAEFSDIQTTANTFKVLDEENNTNATFEHGDLLWAKNVEDDGSLQVNGVKIQVSAQPKYVWDNSTQVWDADPSIAFSGYTDEFASGTVSGGIFDGKPYKEYNIYEVTNVGELNAGDTIVRVSDGSILNDASSQYSPFIDIYDGVETWADFQNVNKTKVRLGNLEGVSNASGYGLYTQNAFLTGSLVVGDLTKAGNYLEYSGGNLSGVFNDIDFDSNTFSLETTNLRIDSQDEIIQIGSGNWVELGDLGSSEYGLSLNTNNYWKYNTLANTYFFKVGSASNFISFNTASGTLDIETDEFSLTAGEMSINSTNGVTIDETNFFKQDKTFSFGGGLLSGNGTTLSISGSGASINVTNFELKTSSEEVRLDSSFGIANSQITSSVTYGDTLDFSGLFFDSDNYLGHITDVDTSANSGYLFRVGGTTSNFLEVNEAGGIAKINVDTFDLATSTLVINSANNKVALGASANAITIDGTEVGFIVDGNGEFKAYADANNYIRLADSAIDIKAESFDLETSTIVLNSDSSGTLIVGADADNQLVGDGVGFFVTGNGNFRVGSIGQGADSYITFDGTTVSIVTDTFDLDSSTLVIDSATNSGKIALGTTPPTGITSGSGIYFDGTGDALIGDATGNRIKFDFSASALEIQSDDFTLEAGDLSINSADRQIQIADSTTRKVTINDDTTFTTIQTLGTGTGTIEIDDLSISNGTVEDTTPVVNVSTYKGDRIDFTVTIDYTETAVGTANTLVGVSLELAEEGGIADYVEETFVGHRFTSTGVGSVTLSGSFKTQTNDLNPASGFGYRLRFYANEGGQREGNLDFDYSITIYNQETQINKGGFISQSSPTNFISDEKIAGNFELDLPIVTGLTYDDLFPYRGKVVKYQSESDKTGTNPVTGGSVTIKPYQIIQLDFTEV